ncbi:acyl-CoA desaturase [Actinophytocola gossypii]|uniref:Acyl-CoA desaturase n=1 Tax=Actinophytocola gossypii TaxID=2812003 RepID=A0ABT2J715_9PSEU|nr:acyl-CoA desaturase [Actinophytocola gossypii]MCT2583658.1 acyl-CoA desaturase [Actinophytocola gossypii]
MDGREHYTFILISALLPLFGVVAAIVLLWNKLVGPADMVAFGIMYVIAGLGVSTGYHRLLAHRAFQTTRPLRIFFAAAGAMAGQGPPITWVAHHRRHHRVADKPGDPHSPYHDEEPGLKGALKGLWHAHMGWLFERGLSSDPMRYCPDILRDKDMRFISKHFTWFVLAGVALPGLIGFTLTGTLFGAMTGALWGGLVRFFFANHVTYAVNSIGHYFGRRRFATPDESRNVGWLALFSFGEAWHNNHHAFPRSASHGMRWYELDISALVIRGLERLKLADHVIRIDRERQEAKALAWEKLGGGRHARSTPAKPLAERRTAAVGIVDVE